MNYKEIGDDLPKEPFSYKVKESNSDSGSDTKDWGGLTKGILIGSALGCTCGAAAGYAARGFFYGYGNRGNENLETEKKNESNSVFGSENWNEFTRGCLIGTVLGNGGLISEP